MNRVKWETPPMPETSGQTPDYDDADELEALMSLALDDRLEEDGAARMEWMLARDAGWSEKWQTWQAIDVALHSAPALDPPPDFLMGVEHKILQWERRRRLQSGLIIGLVALLLWGSALVGLVSLGAFVLANQAEWLNGLIRGIAFYWVRFVSMVQPVWSAIAGLAATPEALALGVCYALLAAVLLGLWIRLLRRTTQVNEQVSV